MRNYTRRLASILFKLSCKIEGHEWREIEISTGQTVIACIHCGRVKNHERVNLEG